MPKSEGCRTRRRADKRSGGTVLAPVSQLFPTVSESVFRLFFQLFFSRQIGTAWLTVGRAKNPRNFADQTIGTTNHDATSMAYKTRSEVGSDPLLLPVAITGRLRPGWSPDLLGAPLRRRNALLPSPPFCGFRERTLGGFRQIARRFGRAVGVLTVPHRSFWPFRPGSPLLHISRRPRFPISGR
jgi:hypothetical protein